VSKFIRINLAKNRKQASNFYTFDIKKFSNYLSPHDSAVPQWFAAP